ncbi:MAG: PbpA [Desulfobacterales bacterium]|nr:PbpA [Desulfobacterales bacterium]
MDAQNWREYQRQLQRPQVMKNTFNFGWKLFGLVLVILVLMCGVFALVHIIPTHWIHDPNDPNEINDDESGFITEKEERHTKNRTVSLKKSDAQKLLNQVSLVNLRSKHIEFIDAKNDTYTLETSLDMPLQEYMLDYLKQIQNAKRGKPLQIAIVAIDPSTGKVLTMIGFDHVDNHPNPCIANAYPAASIFKIVTASAAIEKNGLNANSTLQFTGGKYTLYKSQLKAASSKYGQNLPLSEAFAQSINPVFGKLGINTVGKFTLELYAERMGFNQSIPFEIPVSESLLTIPDDDYNIAEIASGYNRETVISPLHAALISAAILNDGVMPEPTIIEKIIDEKGHKIYQSEPKDLWPVLRSTTSAEMKKLMHETIVKGTARKAFKGFSNHTVLSQLNIGGKTGSMGNSTHDIKYDWFVGLAEEIQGSKKISLAIMIGHGQYLGLKASYYARLLILKYFNPTYTEKNHIPTKTLRASRKR